MMAKGRMRCPDCDSEIPRGSRFCPVCGYTLAPEEIREASGRARHSSGGAAWRVAALLVAAGAVVAAACLLGGGRGSGGADAPLPAMETAAATVQAPSAIPTEVATDAPTAAATARPDGGDSGAMPADAAVPGASANQTDQSLDRVSSAREFYLLLRRMRTEGRTRAYVKDMAMPDAELKRVLGSAFGLESAEYRSLGGSLTLEVEWYPGVRISQAALLGGESGLDARDQAVLRWARQTLGALIAPDMPELDREIAIHDYIVEHTRYAVDAAGDTDSVYGVAENGLAQCAGFCDAFYLLGSLAGLEVDGICGEEIEHSAPHAWNLVRLDGLWYAVDLTWDNLDDGTRMELYLNVPAEFLASNRRWDRDMMPEGDYASELDGNWYCARDPIVYDAPSAVQAAADALAAGRDTPMILADGALDAGQIGAEIAQRCGAQIECMEKVEPWAHYVIYSLAG